MGSVRGVRGVTSWVNVIRRVIPVGKLASWKRTHGGNLDLQLYLQTWPSFGQVLFGPPDVN